MKRIKGALAAIVLSLLVGNGVALADGVLFVGTDHEDFQPTPVLPDRLGRFTTDGAAITGGGILSVDFFINGMGSGGGFLFAGNPNNKKILRIDFDGNHLATIPDGNRPERGCCYEDMIFDGTHLYHAHWSDRIDKIDPTTGDLVTSYEQDQVVGMTFVGNTIWISKWTPKQVGTWDPTTNIFTPKFSTPTNAGGLAYDPLNNILWVGRQGGWVEAYDLTPLATASSPTLIEGSAFQPFGPTSHTIDGLEFIPDDGDGDGVADDVDPCPTFADNTQCQGFTGLATPAAGSLVLDLVFTNQTGQDITSVAPRCNNSTVNIVIKKLTGEGSELVSTVHAHGPAVILAALTNPQSHVVTTPNGGELRVRCDAGRLIPLLLLSQLSGTFTLEASYASFFQAPADIVALDNVFIQADPLRVELVQGGVDPQPIGIDIKPGSFPNSIKQGSGTVPVAILSSATFNAQSVDPTTVTLASAPVKLKGNGTPMASAEDVNGDGLLDLVVHVSTQALVINETDTEAVLEAMTFLTTGTTDALSARNPIRGTDSIRVVP